MNPIVTAFVHEPTASLTYVVREPDGSHCAVVDPVLDYDNQASRTDTASIDSVLGLVRAEGLRRRQEITFTTSCATCEVAY